MKIGIEVKAQDSTLHIEGVDIDKLLDVIKKWYEFVTPKIEISIPKP